MTGPALLETALLMGLMMLAGGCYAGLYTLGRAYSRPALIRSGQICWLIAFTSTVVIMVATPLYFGWKMLLLASAAIYIVIPPITWRYLERLHGDEG